MKKREKCLCGSEKKYTKCCIKLEDKFGEEEALKIALGEKEYSNFSKQLKICSHYDKKNCSDEIIKAHSIQNNKILKKISKNGYVCMPKVEIEENMCDINFREIGRKQATTFTGFCKVHDKIVFQPIEDKEYKGTAEQKFLFAYRAIALENYKKKKVLHMLRETFKLSPHALWKNIIFKDYVTGIELGNRDTNYYLKKFNKALLKQKYDIIETKEIIFDYEVKFACCGTSQIDRDLEGNIINNFYDLDIVKLFFLNIFPNDGKTVILISYLKEDTYYKEMLNKVMEFEDKKKKRFFNILIASSIENIAVNPEFWESFSKEEKESFYSIFNDFDNIRPILEGKNLFDTEIKYDFFK